MEPSVMAMLTRFKQPNTRELAELREGAVGLRIELQLRCDPFAGSLKVAATK
jgi:hypothetical protein